MATMMVGKPPPTCLGCLRRLTSFAVPSATGPSLVQTRGKRKTPTKDQGVVVRLLEDIPRYGRKDSILRIPRGRMRNKWFPTRKAEYMTAARFESLGLTRSEAIGERDPLFQPRGPSAADLQSPWSSSDPDHRSATRARQVEIEHVSSHRAVTLLQTLVPETLPFIRQANPTGSSPSSSSTDALETAPPSGTAIFGSVTTLDIANAIRALIAADAEASRITIEPRHITFVGLEPGVDRVKRTGKWDIHMSLATGVAADPVQLWPVRKVIEVVAAGPEQSAPDV